MLLLACAIPAEYEPTACTEDHEVEGVTLTCDVIRLSAGDGWVFETCFASGVGVVAESDEVLVGYTR